MKRPCFLLVTAVFGLFGCLSSPSPITSRNPNAVRKPDDTSREFRESFAASRAWLGVELMDPDPAFVKNLGAAGRNGVLVTGTVRASPAMKAGLAAGDIILGVNNIPIRDAAQMAGLVGSMTPGTALRIELLRNLGTGFITVVLGNPPPQGSPPQPTWPGLVIGLLDGPTREEFKLPPNAQGVPVMGVSETPVWAAAEQSARNSSGRFPQRGDVILSVGGQRVREPYEFYKALNSSVLEKIPIRFFRGERESFVGFFPNPYLSRNKVVNTWADAPLRVASGAAVPGPAAPADRKNLPLLSVLDFKTDDLARAQVWIVVDVLSGALVDTRRFRVLERSQRDKLLKEVETSTSEAFDEAHQLKIGRLIAADNIVIGSLARIEGNYILSLKLVEVETGETRSAAFKSFESLNAVMEGCPELARKLGEF